MDKDIANKLQTFLIVFLAVIIVIAGLAVAYIFMVPKPGNVLDKYLAAWEREDYQEMYSYLSAESKDKISLEQYQQVYDNFFTESGFKIKDIDKIVNTKTSFGKAEINFHIWFNSAYFGEQYLVYQVNLTREKLVNWRINWNHQLVYPDLKNGERVVRQRKLAKRGSIYDRHGEPLATAGEVVTVGLRPDRITDLDLLTKQLQEILGLKPDWIIRQSQRYSEHPDWFVAIKTLALDKFRDLDPKLRPIPGVFFRRNQGRVYPEAELTAHIVGYIGEVSEDWIDSHPKLDYQIGDIVGKNGIEKAFEVQLRGEPGYILVSQDEAAQKHILLKKPAVRGQDIYLTIDTNLQKAAWAALGDQNGAFVNIDPETGELLTIVTRPSYDPNLFSLGITSQEWQQLSSDPRQPLFNRALQGLYPPGSVFKLITASAALNSNLVKPETEFEDNGTFRVHGNIVRNYQNEVFNKHQFKDAITHSINTTFAKIGLDLGKDRLREYASRFGIDEEEELPLSVRTSKLGSLDNQIHLAWSSIGQAQVMVSPLQMAEVVATIAGKGELRKPLLIYKTIKYNADGELAAEEYSQPEIKRRVIKADTAAVLTQLMVQVVREGTGQQAEITDFPLAGKTGTAEINSGTDETHAWFVGFAPVDKPSLAFSVFVEKGGVGGQVAAPRARQFLIDIFNSSTSKAETGATQAPE